MPVPPLGRMVAEMADQPKFLSGKLLLAMPGMADPRFERAAIAICVHDENGAVGVGVGHKRAGISFIFRGLWTVVFVGEAHEIGHTVREAVA